MVPVPARVLLAIGAWLLGVGAATAGSLFAVSLIGQSIGGSPAQQLTVSAVSRALATGHRAADPSQSHSHSHSPSVTRRHRAVIQTPPAGGTAASAGTLLNSAGGSVLAGCRAAGAYLISWSPQQGFEADDVVRGPAANAVVVFEAGSHGVRVAVSCAGSVPSESVSDVGGHGGWSDDSGESGDS
jgi:hypothetical protein